MRRAAADTRRLTDQQIPALLREWRRELRLLNDWTIDVVITHEIAPRHGHVRVAREKTCAYIRLLDPGAANYSEMEPLDMEVALVHELLHVALRSISKPEGTHEDTIQEQAINRLSQRLVAMKRELRKMRRSKPSALPIH
jgi:hypothetical protein